MMGFFFGDIRQTMVFGAQQVDAPSGVVKGFQIHGLIGEFYPDQHGSFWQILIKLIKSIVMKIRHRLNRMMRITGLFRITAPYSENKTSS